MSAQLIASLDYETYSAAGVRWDGTKWIGEGSKKGIKLVGSYNYISHPTFEPLCLAYVMPNGVEQFWLPWWPPPLDLHLHVMSGGLLQAWNSLFEWRVWTMYCTPRLGWPMLRMDQMRCSMARAAINGYPRGLDDAGQVLSTLQHESVRWDEARPIGPVACEHGRRDIDCDICVPF